MTWEETAMLLNMDALFWEMLVGKMNMHLQGINLVRKHLIMMADNKAKFPSHQYANIVWAVYDDSMKHLNQTVPYKDILHIAPMNL